MNFLTLAEQAQRELEGELLRLEQKEADLNTKSSAVEAQLALADQRTAEAASKAKELQAREEEVTRREINMRKDTDLKADLQQAMAERKIAADALIEAKEARDAAKMSLLDLTKRELALSEREKTYREEIKQQIASKMLGI